MKNVYEVLRQEEFELQRIQKEIEALRIAARLLADESDAQPALKLTAVGGAAAPVTPVPTTTTKTGVVNCDVCGCENIVEATVCQQCDVPLPSALPGGGNRSSTPKSGASGTPAVAAHSSAPVATGPKSIPSVGTNIWPAEREPRPARPVKGLITILLIVALMPLIGIDPQRHFQRIARASNKERRSITSRDKTTEAAVPIQMAAGTSADMASTDSKAPESPPGSVSRVEACKLVHKVNPVYPSTAAAITSEQTVLLGATVAKDGTVDNIHVLKGEPTLASAAIDAVRQWRYQPYLVDGHPAEVETTISVKFSPPRK